MLLIEKRGERVATNKKNHSVGELLNSVGVAKHLLINKTKFRLRGEVYNF